MHYRVCLQSYFLQSKPPPCSSCTPLNFYSNITMDALWNLEDKWKISTREAILLLVMVVIIAVTGVFAAAILVRKGRRSQHLEGQQQLRTGENESACEKSSCSWFSFERGLKGTMRWSSATKWEDKSGRWWRERSSPLLGLEGRGHWQSHNSVSAVWQRPILMGEKCELPRFSGLILYDERGHPVHDSEIHITCMETPDQEKEGQGVRTTLKDLL